MLVSQHPRIGIIGADAIAGFYGLMLARAGFDMHFLLRREFTAVAGRGLQYNAGPRALNGGRRRTSLRA